tara:strand:- start:742 stop:981 length:240 start_codon:yes stop_codon:yes gene_type:complete
LPLAQQINISTMKTNPFNLCKECLHKHNCVLTDQKDKVFSCSEFDEEIGVELPRSEVPISEEYLEERYERQNAALQMAG